MSEDGEHCGSLPAHSSIRLTLRGLGTGRKGLTEEKLFGFFSFFKIYQSWNVGGNIWPICVTKWVLASFSVKRDYIFPLTIPPAGSSLDLGTDLRHGIHLEDIYHISFHCCFSFKTFTKCACSRHFWEECHLTHFTPTSSLYPVFSLSGWPWWATSSSSAPAVAWHHRGTLRHYLVWDHRIIDS